MLRYNDIHRAMFAPSCVAKEDKFANVLEKIGIHPQIAVELGTYRGYASAILASISKKVYTFDIVYQAIAEPLWEYLKVKDKIIYTIIGKNNERDQNDKIIQENINQRDAAAEIEIYLKTHNICPDFVFADGPHRHYGDVKRIFDLFVKLGVKRILFDDAVERFPGTLQLAKEIKAKIFYGRFAYWERKEN